MNADLLLFQGQAGLLQTCLYVRRQACDCADVEQAPGISNK